MPTRDYAVSLNEALADAEEASAYLSACLDEGPDEFLLGLLDVARARGELPEAMQALGLSDASFDSLAANAVDQPFTKVAALAQRLGVRLTCSEAH